jgi:hypothetical protein
MCKTKNAPEKIATAVLILGAERTRHFYKNRKIFLKSVRKSTTEKK